jgi:ubiquinone/menaquinone biosynthesis C-methylase UbiE
MGGSEVVEEGAFEAEEYERLARLEASSFWFRGRNRLIVWALERYFPDARSLLEVGCGTGFVLSAVRAAFPPLDLVGGELSNSALRIARRRLPDARLLRMDARRLPRDERFDVVGAFDVLEHVEDDERVLAELSRVVRPGGGALLCVPQHPRLWSEADDVAGHVRRYTQKELTRKVRDADLAVRRASSFVSLSLPLMAISRWRQRRPGSGYDQWDELEQGRGVQWMLGRMLDADIALIRRGVSLPAGGSLLVVAEKPRLADARPAGAVR